MRGSHCDRAAADPCQRGGRGGLPRAHRSSPARAAVPLLPHRQRAALVLRDVLGFHTAEVANMLDTSEDSVKGALKRARATLKQGLPADRDHAPLAASSSERELVKRFADAWETNDIDSVVSLLTDDA